MIIFYCIFSGMIGACVGAICTLISEHIIDIRNKRKLARNIKKGDIWVPDDQNPFDYKMYKVIDVKLNNDNNYWVQYQVYKFDKNTGEHIPSTILEQRMWSFVRDNNKKVR